MKGKNAAQIREWIADLATIAVAVIAIAVGVPHLLSDDTGGLPSQEDRELGDWAPLLESDHRIGPEDAQVVLIEFGDYECPYCRRAEPILKALLEKWPNELAVQYHHLPLSFHENAYPAARMAVCGEEQGRFRQVHDILYNVELAGLNPADVADQAGIEDTARFVECAEDEDPVADIERDLELAGKYDIRATPSLVLNGILLGGGFTEERLSELIEETLNDD